MIDTKAFLRIICLIDILGIVLGSLTNNLQLIVSCGFYGVIMAILSNDY
ncbi:MAG: hypothetical protein E6356_13785 [Terrisporobacter othiniensis]|nr:hypothetical protein [Terrisporobacter othiniensis]